MQVKVMQVKVGKSRAVRNVKWKNPRRDYSCPTTTHSWRSYQLGQGAVNRLWIISDTHCWCFFSNSLHKKMHQKETN